MAKVVSVNMWQSTQPGHSGWVADQLRFRPLDPARGYRAGGTTTWMSALLMVVAMPLSAPACSPIFQLTKVFSGANWFGESVVWLAVAVAVKCAAFVFLERQLAWFEAVGFMVLANVFSSFFGLIIAVQAGWPGMLFMGLPVVYLCSVAPVSRLLKYWEWSRGAEARNPWLHALWIPVLVVATWLLFGNAYNAMHKEDYSRYWLWKVAYVTLGLFVGIGLTSLWEEWAVARLASRSHPESSYLVSVVRSNYIAFGVIVLIAAIRILPKRLRSDGFLAWVGDLVDRMFG